MMKGFVSSIKYALAGLVVMAAVVLPSPVTQAQTRNNADAGAPTSGNPCGDGSFLLFPAWYNGLTVVNGNSCDIKSPTEAGGVASFIWKIVFNIVTMLLVAAGYAAVGFIIYGGYKYMISAGSPDGMVAARKTIMNAVIGLIISIAAVAIVRTFTSGLGIG